MSDALLFGPHPDDLELTCGGLAARLARSGRRVALVDLTSGELGTRGDRETRAREANAAARVLGVDSRESLGLPDGGLDRHDRTQLRALIECIRRHRPHLVVAPDPEDPHPDHTEGAQLVRRACHLAGLVRYEAGGERWRPVRLLHALYRSGARPHLVVDVSEVWEVRMAALREHRSQLDPAAGAPTYLTAPGFLAEIEGRARHWGALIGVTHGEAYRSSGPVAITDPASLLEPGREAT